MILQLIFSKDTLLIVPPRAHGEIISYDILYILSESKTFTFLDLAMSKLLLLMSLTYISDPSSTR